MSLFDRMKATQSLGPPNTMHRRDRERLRWGGISRLYIVSGAHLRNVLITIATTEILTPFELPQLSLQTAISHCKIGRGGK